EVRLVWSQPAPYLSQRRFPLIQPMNQPFAWLKYSALAAVFLVVLCCGCGGGSMTPPGPTSISAQQSAAAASQVEGTFVAAVQQMTSDVCPLPPCCDINRQNFCTMTIASETPCSGGGTTAFNGSLSGDMNFYATGGTSGTLSFAPSDCAIPNSNLVMS